MPRKRKSAWRRGEQLDWSDVILSSLSEKQEKKAIVDDIMRFGRPLLRAPSIFRRKELEMLPISELLVLRNRVMELVLPERIALKRKMGLELSEREKAYEAETRTLDLSEAEDLERQRQEEKARLKKMMRLSMGWVKPDEVERLRRSGLPGTKSYRPDRTLVLDLSDEEKAFLLQDAGELSEEPAKQPARRPTYVRLESGDYPRVSFWVARPKQKQGWLLVEPVEREGRGVKYIVRSTREDRVLKELDDFQEARAWVLNRHRKQIKYVREG